MKLDTIEDIKRAHTATGGYFFSPATMRFFGSRILSGVYGPGVFVTSEQDKPVIISTGWTSAAWEGARRYTVRVCREDGDIDTLSEYGQFETRAAAIAWAKAYALGADLALAYSGAALA
tara:strand:- start:124 stop:480 length:357 start_codon:yes stop_codon:yes gene_type:complete